jgi:site-specific DNA-methyltransferase (adenine-specific)
LPEKITWTAGRRKLKDLRPWERNPRQITKEQARRLAESFDEFGQVETIAISPADDVYNGHQRLAVLLEKHGGDYEIEVRISSRALTEKEREKLTVYLHKGAAGEWNFDALANGFEVDELIEWGFRPEELGLDKDYGIEKPEDAGAQIDKAEELREKWDVKTGQLWRLGDHRIICGDCTDRAVVEKVMAGEKAVCMWTDPPYGVEYVGKTKDAMTIENDGADDLPGLLTASFLLADSVLVEGAPIYVAHPAGALQMVFDKCFVDVGWKFHETLVWVKDSMVLGHSDYHYKHEPIIYGWKGKNRFWYSGRDQVSVFEIPRPKRSAEHPTMKPPELVEVCMQNSTKNADIVYEPFSGSGTSIIACERLGRKCRAIEISPAYVAVSIQRWVDTTGGRPELLDQ